MQVQALFDLGGKSALVSGGGRGIGRWMALGLAEAGARVFVASRKLERCQAVAAEIRERTGRDAHALHADLSQPGQVESLVEQVLGETERLDVLVNNAAAVWAAPTLDYPIEGWDRVFDLNVRGLWLLSQHVARHMRDQGGGSIVQVSSISAFRGSREEEQNVVAYNASKGAVVALTIDMAVKLAPYGIRVNGIAPGPFDTDMMNHLRDDPERLRAYLHTIPLGRAGGEDDVKGVVVFLASEAARFMTGHTLVLDGGALCL